MDQISAYGPSRHSLLRSNRVAFGARRTSNGRQNPQTRSKITRFGHCASDKRLKTNTLLHRHYVFCETDQEAVNKAKLYVDGHDVELWEGTRHGDCAIPTGATVLVPIWMLPRNPHLWEQAEAVNPARFLGDNAPDRFSYLPFAAGPHVLHRGRACDDRSNAGLSHIYTSFLRLTRG
jgi:hypothetical protein